MIDPKAVYLLSVEQVCELFDISPQNLSQSPEHKPTQTPELDFLSNFFGMIDRDFEQRAALLTNNGYFDRVRELCREGSSVKEAWEKVESELPHGLRRFTHYFSFRMARIKEANGALPAPQFKGE